MAKEQKWSGLEKSIEIHFEPENPLKTTLPGLTLPIVGMFELFFESNGSYDPGCFDYPPCSDEERTPVRAVLTDDEGRETKLNQEQLEYLFDAYEEEVNEVEFDVSDYDNCDGSDDYDDCEPCHPLYDGM